MSEKLIQHSDKILQIKSVLSPQRCDELIRFSEAAGYSEAPISVADEPVMRKDLRSNDRLIVDDVELCDELWQLIKPYVQKFKGSRPVAGLNERLRFYRYHPGQIFEWHYDGFFRRQNGERSFYTLLFYLNGDFSGGTTAFEEVEIIPQQGDALIFLHHQLHAGLPVEEGCKYVLRSDIMYAAAE